MGMVHGHSFRTDHYHLIFNEYKGITGKGNSALFSLGNFFRWSFNWIDTFPGQDHQTKEAIAGGGLKDVVI